jgi:hypothetical protein
MRLGELTTAELEVLETSGADAREHGDLPDPVGAWATELAAILETRLSTSACGVKGCDGLITAFASSINASAPHERSAFRDGGCSSPADHGQPIRDALSLRRSRLCWDRSHP